MFWDVRFDPPFQAEVDRLKSEAEAWGKEEAIRVSKDLPLDACGKSIVDLAWDISNLALEKFEKELLKTNHGDKITAFYVIEPFFTSNKEGFKKDLAKLIKNNLKERWAEKENFNSEELSFAIKRIAMSG